MKPTSKISRTFTKHQAKVRGNNQPRGRGLRLFSLVPIHTLEQHYIRLDTLALHTLIRSTTRNLGGLAPVDFNVVADQQTFIANANADRQRFFKISKATSAGRRFGYSLSTDGVFCSVSVRKQVAQAVGLNDYGFDDQGVYQPLVTQPGTRICALDPGRRSLFVAVDGGGRDDYIEWTNAKWQDQSGTLLANRTARSIKAEGFGLLHAIETQMPTPKCYRWADYAQHLQYFLGSRDFLHGFYEDFRWRKLRRKTFITRQKAYDTVYQELMAGNESTVIIYGDGGLNFDHASRGNPPTPNKHLYHQLKRRNPDRVRLGSEFRSSITCSLCSHKLYSVGDGPRNYPIKQCE